MHHWVRASPSDFFGTLPQPRSGHTAVNIGKSKIVVFGGLVDKKFLADITVYDIDNGLWYRPECTSSGSDGQVGPSPRAFHIAIAIDCHMFIFGGRSSGKRLGDFWVLDTDIWQWSELTSFGDLPTPRDFTAASAIGNRKIVMYGGWDGKKWLSDVFVLDTISLEWTALSVSGAPPPPRCGHTATMVEKRLLVYGGRGDNLRTNTFQEERNDEDMTSLDSNGSRESAPTQVPVGPVMRGRAKRFKEGLMALLQAMWKIENNMSTWSKEDENLPKYINMVQGCVPEQSNASLEKRLQVWEISTPTLAGFTSQKGRPGGPYKPKRPPWRQTLCPKLPWR